MKLSEPARRAQIEKWHARRLNRARQKRFMARDALVVEDVIPVCGRTREWKKDLRK